MPDDQQQQTPPVNLSDPAALTAAYTKYLEYLQQVGNQRPAQAPVISQAQLDANQPTSLLGQIGEALAGGPPSDVPMTADQRERAGVRGLFNFSRGLLGTGTFDTIGQALDRGLTEAERGQYNQEAQIAYGQSAAQDWQRQQMADRLAALKESIPLLQGIQRMNLPSLYGPGGGPGAQAGNAPGSVPGAPGSYEAGIIGHEGATGGVLDAAWNGFTAANPDLFKGMTPQQIQAARSDPAMVTKAVTWVAQQNAVTLAKNNIPVNGPNLGLAHFLGGTGASWVYNQPDNTPVRDVLAQHLSPKELETWLSGNPILRTGTVGDVKKMYASLPDPGFVGTTKPPAATAAAAPPGGPAQPAAKPPAQGGGGDTAALPLPPKEPPGAVPTVSTPEEAAATAKAAGTYVQVPGTEGLWARPEGGSTSTPPLIMPGTQTASLTPVAPTPPGPQPPPGVVTPPAQQPPAEQPPAQPPAQQPPVTTPPARDIMARNPDGSFVVPDDKVSVPEYQQRNRHVPSPEEMQQRGMVLPDNPTALQTAYAGVQEAEREAAAARQAAQTTYTMGGDPAKAMAVVNTADKNAQDARNAYVNLIQGVGEKNTKALQDYYTEQDRQLAADYKAKVVDPANTARQQQQASDLKIHEGLVAAGTADDQKVLQGIDATTESAHDTLSTLAAAKQLSVAAGNKSALAVLAPGLATMLQRSGLLSQDEGSKLDAQQALDGVLSKMAGTMRSSMGFSRMTNMDLQFLQNMVGTSNIPESRRNAMFAFMQTALERQYQYGALVREFYGGGPNAGGMSLAKAREAADDKLGHIVQTVPDNLPPDQGDLFVQQHVSPGTFYVRDGQLRIRGQ